jgi:hypothetical protein
MLLIIFLSNFLLPFFPYKLEIKATIAIVNKNQLVGKITCLPTGRQKSQ